MKLRLGVASILAGVALAGLAGCASSPSPERQWTRAGATPEEVKSALYWCSQTKVDRFRALGTPADQERRVRVDVDDECMEQRGFTKVDPQK